MCKDYFIFILNWMILFKLYFIHSRMFKCIKMDVNEIIVMVSNIKSIHIVRNIFVLFSTRCALLFYFVFTRHEEATAVIVIMITKNNHGVPLAPFIGAIYAAVLENQIVKYSKMIKEKVNLIRLTIIFLMMRHIFEILLLFSEVTFIVMTKTWYFGLSYKDQFIFICVRMLKLYFQQLQIFTTVKMIVNGIILMIYDILFIYNAMNVILLRYKCVNDLLFQLMVFIFISMDITATEILAARRTTINNISSWIWFSVTTIAVRRIIHATVVSTIGAIYKNIQKDKFITFE